MTKLLKQLDNEPAIQGGGASASAETPPSKGVDYSAFEEIEKTFSNETEPKPAAATTEKTAEQLVAEQAQKTPEQLDVEKASAATKLAEETRLAEDAKRFEGKTPEEIETIKKTDLEKPASQEAKPLLKFADDLTLGIEGELTFASLAKELNLDVKENNFNAFKEAVTAKLENTKTEAWSGNFMRELEKEPIAVQEAFILAKNNLDLSEIAKPVAQIESLMSLSNFDLVKKDLELSKDEYNVPLTKEVIEQQLAEITEKGDIDKAGNFIRGELNKSKEFELERRTHLINDLKAKEQVRVENEIKKVQESLENQLKNTKDFMGIQLDDTVGKGIIKRFQEGKYNDMRINNPEKLLKAILFEEFGDYAINEIKQSAQSKVIQKQMKELHNIPPAQPVGNLQTRSINTGKFSEIEEMFAKK